MSKKQRSRDALNSREYWEHEAGWHNYTDESFQHYCRDKLYNLAWKCAIEFFVNEAQIKGTDRILDLGCGWGRITIGVKQSAKEARMVASDMVLGNLKRAQEVMGKELSGDDTVFCQADAGRLPFKDASFDVLVSYRMYQHVGDPGAAAREFLRVLSPGGRVAVVVPNRLNLFLLSYYAKTFSPFALRRCFLGAGFSQVQAGSIRFLPSPFSERPMNSRWGLVEKLSRVPMARWGGAMATVVARKPLAG